MSKQQLYDRAKRVGIDGRSSMSKPELIKALRDHGETSGRRHCRCGHAPKARRAASCLIDSRRLCSRDQALELGVIEAAALETFFERLPHGELALHRDAEGFELDKSVNRDRCQRVPLGLSRPTFSARPPASMRWIRGRMPRSAM